MNGVERLAARLVLEDDLLAFTRYFFKARFAQDFLVNWHHGAICEHLQAVEDGQIRNLIINLPPGGGKTELVGISWPARAIARNPLSRFLMLSYSDELVALNSQTCRNLIQLEEYQELWSRKVAEDSKAKKRWNVLDNDKPMGGMYASTPHAQVTGFRAGYMSDGFNGAIILDDPMKAADAESDIVRREINLNIARTVRSRRAKPDVPIVLIQQRLHEEDTTGWLLAGELGEEFERLTIPALDGSGKSYWEFKEPTEDLLKFKAVQPYIFNAQYQQEPSPDDGEFFKREMFVYYDELPKHVKSYGASDFATKEGEGDYTVHGVIALDEKEDLYLVDWWREQATPDVWIERMLDMANENKTLAWGVEKGVIANSIGPLLNKRMQERKEYPYIVPYPSVSDKPTRARSIQGRMNVRKLYVPKKPWVSDLISECMKFPMGKHDDQVDVLGMFGRMIDGLQGGFIPKPKDDHITAKPITFDELRKMGLRK